MKETDDKLLAMHSDFQVKKAHVSTTHGIMPTIYDGWREKHNSKPRVVVETWVTSTRNIGVK
jgi:hypothetical protein